MKRNLVFLLIFAFAIIGSSFAVSRDQVKSKIKLPPQEHIEQEAEDTSEPARIPVLEYHNFNDEEGRWTRTPDNFYGDLQWLYNNNYRPVTVEQFLKMEFQMEPGMKPFLMTFDDASENQFRYLEDGTIDPNSAIGVMNRFIEEHPDFGTSATFFVLPYSFGQADLIDEKLKYLVRTEREIGNHTFGHEDLENYDGETIQWTLASQEKYVQEQLGESYQVRALAYPLGHYPDGDLFEYIKSGESEGHSYEIDAAFLVGSHPTLLPDNADFEPHRIPRIQAFDDEWGRWFNRAPGETAKSEEVPNFRPYRVDKKHSVGVQEVPDLDGTLKPSEEVYEETEEIAEVVADEVVEEITEEPAPEEPKFPYETCKPSDYELSPNGKVFWTWAKNKTKMIQLNPIPAELKPRDGKFYYTITGEEGSISEKFLSYSRHYRMSKFKDAILEANPESDFEAEEEIIIPDIPLLLVNRPIHSKDPWGIYLTGYSATSDEGPRLVQQLKDRGGNLIIFDVKEIDGYVFYPSEVPMVAETGADAHTVIPDLDNFVRYWHEQDIYLAARIVIFKDINLARSRPDLAIQNQYGAPWENREGSVWVDPSQPETQQYILDLVDEIAQSGVDEIQFDYIRFPTLGPVEDTRYNFDEANVEKYEVIRNFVARVHDQLRPYDTKLSLDVYGVIAWNDGYDARSTGQRMECLGPYIDVVYPMVYPSHFGPGFAGYDNPGDHPYYFVAESVRLFRHYLQGTNTDIRPWLQAFAWRVSDYGPWYIDEQVKGASDEGVYEYALWNAGNRYFD
ncbi:putative glycoside hydrolase [Patescibacteria group bacterium]